MTRKKTSTLSLYLKTKRTSKIKIATTEIYSDMKERIKTYLRHFKMSCFDTFDEEYYQAIDLKCFYIKHFTVKISMLLT